MLIARIAMALALMRGRVGPSINVGPIGLETNNRTDDHRIGKSERRATIKETLSRAPALKAFAARPRTA